VRNFRDLAQGAIALGRRYDCLIPVSGGKDSTWQVVTCLEHGLNPLAFSWKPPGRTTIGALNLANLISLGVDHLDLTIDPRVERALTRAAFLRFGAAGLPFHMAMFSSTHPLAAGFDVPLVVWGENSAVEYAGEDDSALAPRLNAAWLSRFGVTHGTAAPDWVSGDLSERDLAPYRGIPDEELERKKIRVVFLGDFFRWDPARTLRVAQEHGFRARPEGPVTGIHDHADIDDEFISIHHHLKWFKYGFTRSFDNLSIEIRNGRLGRDRAVEIIRELGDETPYGDIARFCEYTALMKDEFNAVCERFRDLSVWSRRDGRWVIEGFIVPDRVWT